MKVLHVFNELKFSGAEIMYVSAAPFFKEKGILLTAMSTAPVIGEYSSFFKEQGYNIVHFPLSSKSSLGVISYVDKIIKYLRFEKFDVVHIHRSDLKFLFAYSSWRAGCQSIYTFHNVFSSKWYTYFYHIFQRKLMKLCFGTKMQTISDSVYNHEVNHFFNQTELVYNWYNIKQFYPANHSEKENFRAQLDIDKNALVFISIGGCSPVKRHSDIIMALPKILEYYPEAIYLHLGEGSVTDDEYALAEKLNVLENIRFEGNRTDVRKFLIVSDIYIMTSKFEGISLTTIEAMACGIPAILYNVPGLRDFNSSVPCSILIEENYNVLANEILDLFQEKELKYRMIENAKQHVDERFNMEKNAEKIINLYKKK